MKKPQPIINLNGLSKLYLDNNPTFTYLPNYLKKIKNNLTENCLLFVFEYENKKPELIENIKNIYNHLFKYNIYKDIIREQLLDNNWKLINKNKNLENQILEIIDINENIFNYIFIWSSTNKVKEVNFNYKLF